MNIRTLTSICVIAVSAFILLPAAEVPTFTPEELEALDAKDAELFKDILGAWYFESLSPSFMHVAQRTIYLEDGTFVVDYRISRVGSIEYRRATGVWSVVMGCFFERETRSNDGQIFPAMLRWVDAVSDKELKIRSRTNVEAVLITGPQAAKDFNLDLKGLSQKDFDAALKELGIIGFVSEAVGEKDEKGNPYYKWILQSKLLPNGSDNGDEKPSISNKEK